MKLCKTRSSERYKILLAISHNPHTKNPDELWKAFDSMDGSIKTESSSSEEFDRSGFESLKRAMSSSNKIIVK